MSLAENLLNSLDGSTYDNISNYAEDSGEEHIVVTEQRQIIVPSSLQMIGVQNDKNVETREFDCPRYWDDGVDIYGMTLFINYILPNGNEGSYLPYNVSLDEINNSIIHFTWKIEDYFTVKSGNLKISIVAKKTNDEGVLEQRWGTLINSQLFVGEGINADNQIVSPDQEDLLTQLIQRVEKLEQSGGGTADLSNYYTKQQTYSKNEIDAIYGDVEASLDEIIEIQESLIGGASV